MEVRSFHCNFLQDFGQGEKGKRIAKLKTGGIAVGISVTSSRPIVQCWPRNLPDDYNLTERTIFLVKKFLLHSQQAE